mgnify:CR=1 FL=1
MSNVFKKKYSGFQRHILKEFMREKELIELDKKYNNAKLLRITRRSLLALSKNK